MTSWVRDILSKTNQQVGLLDDDKKMAYAREMSGFAGLGSAFFGQIGIKEFKTIIEWKRLIVQKAKNWGHH